MRRTESLNEKYKKGFIPWDETSEAKKNTRVGYWKQFYHKPYECDWWEATQKATERVLRTGEE